MGYLHVLTLITCPYRPKEGALFKGKMTTLQPCLALALAVLCAFLSAKPPDGKWFRPINLWALIAYVAFLAASTYCAIRLGHLDDHRAIIAGIVAGGVVSILAGLFSNLAVGVSIGLATAGACVPHLVRADSFPEVGLVFAFSISIGAVFFASHVGSTIAGLTGGLITMADYLGKAGDEVSNRALIGVAMGIALSVAALVGLGLKKATPKALGKLEPCLLTVLAAGAGYAVSRWAIGGDLWIILGIAAVAGLVVHWLVPVDREPSPFRVGVSVVIWLALATVSYSLIRGFGMATGVLEGCIVLILLGNGRAIYTLGPALGFVIYRVLRDASPDTSKALDLGQHYGVTGIVVGAVIPVLYADWFERHRPTRAAFDAISSLLWAFILVCLPVLSIVVLGAKGASGVVVGLGFSGLWLAYRKFSGAPAIAVVIAAGAANAVAVDWIGETMNITRQEKLHAFGWWVVAMAISAVVILAVSKWKTSEAAS